MELQEIINRVREGDAMEFGRLVSRYRDMAFGYAMSLLNHEQLAEDAVQEAFVVAYTQLDRLQQTHAFGAWLRGIVRNQCFRELRNTENSVSLEIADGILYDETDLAYQAERTEVYEQVHRAISELPFSLQEVVQMHYQAGLSQKEVGAQLNLTPGTVNMRLHKARTRLRRRLARMNERTTEPAISAGRVVSSDGHVVTLQFATNAVPPVFSLLSAGLAENLCVVQHLSAGRVRALATRTNAIWTPGQEVIDSHQPFTEALSHASIQKAVDALHSRKTANDPLTGASRLPSGIKTIEAFAPLIPGGKTGIFTEWGLGVLVLLPEILRNLDIGENRQAFLVFVPPIRDAAQWKEIVAEITIGTRNIEFVYVPVTDPIASQFVNTLKDLDTTLVLSRRLAEQSIWPCLDPLKCHSRRSNLNGTAKKQTEVLTDIQQLLKRYYMMQFSSGEEADRTLSIEDMLTVQRARKALRFLSQPFFVAEPYTGRPGVFVSADETLLGLTDIASGRYDAISPEAFYMVGAAPQLATS